MQTSVLPEHATSTSGLWTSEIDVTLSVIIPTLNEAANIAGAIEAAREAGAVEVVVVDGGSDDDTCRQAQGADRVLTAPRGRASQQNAGAQVSHGDVLLFLHADCRLPAGATKQIEQALADERTVGGCFRQRIDAPGAAYRFLEWGNALRVRLWGLAYGDQAIFVRRAAFNQLGGFPPLALMEDLFFMKRLRRAGKLRLLGGPVVVSPRRWQQQGIIRQTAINWWLTTLAQCGVSPDRLARYYQHVR